jgi:hypothetical protein
MENLKKTLVDSLRVIKELWKKFKVFVAKSLPTPLGKFILSTKFDKIVLIYVGISALIKVIGVVSLIIYFFF